MGEVLQRFSPAAVRAVQYAKEAARRVNAAQIGTEHLLLGLTRESEGMAARALERLGVTTRRVREELLREVAPSGEGRAWNAEARRALEAAAEEASRLNPKEGRASIVDTEHLLLAVIRDEESAASRMLLALGVERGRVRQEVIQALALASAKAEAQPENGAKQEAPAAVGAVEQAPLAASAREEAPLAASAAQDRSARLSTMQDQPAEIEVKEAVPAGVGAREDMPVAARAKGELVVQVVARKARPVRAARAAGAKESRAAAPIAAEVATPLIDVNTHFGYDPRTGITTTLAQVRQAVEAWGVETAYTYSLNALLYDARSGNEETLAACAQDAFFRPVAVLSPIADRPLAMVGWAKERGFAFVRIFPDGHGFAVDGQACRDLLGACGAANLPVMISALAAGPANLRRALDGIKGKFILTDNRYGILGEVVALTGRLPDLYVEVSGVNTPDGVAVLAETFGVDRLLWGSGYPGMQVGCAAMLLQHSGLPPQQIELIAHHNAQRLLEAGR